MNFIEAINSGFKNYVNFNGRAMRSEYWFWQLFTFLVYLASGALVLGLAADNTVGLLIFILINFAVFIPTLTVSVRRLHDIGKSGLWYLIILVPYAGAVIFIVFMCKDSQPDTNRYGPNPKSVRAGSPEII